MTPLKFDLFPERIGIPLSNEYDVLHTLGKGAFGTVRLVRCRSTGALRACKTISKSRLLSPTEIDDVKREVEILYTISPHPTVTDIIAVFEDDDALHIVMEYAAGGELFDRIVAKGSFSEAEAARHFRRMAEMVAHCHSLGVVHRDLKPENFVLDTKDDDANLLACDFGLGAFFKPGEMLSTLVGSAFYVAPEVLRRRYGPEADVWSLGVVLYILLSGVPPFWGKTDKDTFISILRGNPDMTQAPWPSISEAAQDVVRRLLTVDPGQRATVQELLKHPWLAQHGVASDAPLDGVVVSRMKRFAALGRVKKAAVLAAARHLAPSEIQGMRELFQAFDANGDGVVSLDELHRGLKATCGSRLTAEEIEEMWRDVDADASGAIDWHEFVASTVNVALLHREEVLSKLFRELDTDGSGTLTIEEVYAAIGQGPLGHVEKEEVIEFMENADLNKDGVVDWEEFLSAWRRQGGPGERAVMAATELRRGLSATADDVAKEMELQE